MELLSVTDVAARAHVSRRYVLAEITAGRLQAQKVGRQYVILFTDFAAWMDNPRRGSRSNT